MVTDLAALVADDAVDTNGFITVDTPTDFPTEAPEKACVVCGKDVSDIYKRRMKEYRCEAHKKTGPSKLGTDVPKRSAGKDVEAAVAALDSWYSMITMGLFVAGAHKAATLLSEAIEGDEDQPGLTAKNRTYLAQTPVLAKKIADMGKTSATYGFFSAQALVFGPVAILAAGELMEKWGKPKNQTPEDFGDIPATGPGGFPIDG